MTWYGEAGRVRLPELRVSVEPPFRKASFWSCRFCTAVGSAGRAAVEAGPCGHRVEGRIGGEARRGGDLRLRDRRSRLRTRTEEHGRSRGRFGFLAQRVVRIVAGGRIGGRHRLLRLHDGRAEIARQRRPQFGNGGRQLRVIRRQRIQPFRLRDAIDVVKLGLLAGSAPLRLQRPHQRAEHGDREAAGKDGQGAPVQARDRARLRAQRHRLGRDLVRRLRRGEVGSVVLAHGQFLRATPSVRSMRTTSPPSPPRRSSAAPNSDPRCSTASGSGSSPVARRPAHQ